MSSNHTQEIKIKQLLLLQIQSHDLAKYTNTHQSLPSFFSYDIPPHDKLLHRLRAREVSSFGESSNQLLQAFGYLLLKSVYGEILNEPLLNTIKNHLYSEQVNLTSIQQNPLNLSNSEMKKFMAEFFIQLCFTDYEVIFLKKITKHTVIIQIMVVFLRCLLFLQGIIEAKTYSKILPSEKVIQILSDIFDLNFRKTKGAYLFLQNNLFLYEINKHQILVGLFGDQNKNYQVSPSNSNRSSLRQKVENTCDMRQSSQISNAATPQFCSWVLHKQRNRNSVHQTRSAYSINKGSPSKLHSQIKSFQEIIEDDSFCQQRLKPTSPSVLSLEEKLFDLQSPSSQIQSSKSFSNFIKDNNLFIPEKNTCDCMLTTKKNLKIHSNLYKLTIAIPNKQPKPFPGKYTFHTSSKKQFPQFPKEKSSLNNSIPSTKKESQNSQIKETDRSFSTSWGNSFPKNIPTRPLTQMSQPSTIVSKFTFTKHQDKNRCHNYV